MSAPYRTVEELCRIPPALDHALSLQFTSVPDVEVFVTAPDGLLLFFSEVATPFARLLNLCFPSSAFSADRIPEASREFLIPHVGNLLRCLQWGYVIGREIANSGGDALQVPPEIINTLLLAQKFHMLLGQPDYGFDRDLERSMHRDIHSLLIRARETRKLGDAVVDFALGCKYDFLLCVPSWDATHIALLQHAERGNPAVGEEELLEERLMDYDDIGRRLSRMVLALSGVNWYPVLRY